MIKKISNFFTKHQGAITVLSLIFIYLGSFDMFNRAEFTLIKIITLIAGIVLIAGIFVNPFVKIRLQIKNKKAMKEAKNVTKI